jgi:hypothetical protein
MAQFSEDLDEEYGDGTPAPPYKMKSAAQYAELAEQNLLDAWMELNSERLAQTHEARAQIYASLAQAAATLKAAFGSAQ